MPVFYEVGKLRINSDHVLYIEETRSKVGKAVLRVHFTTGKTMEFSGKEATQLLSFVEFDVPQSGRE